MRLLGPQGPNLLVRGSGGQSRIDPAGPKKMADSPAMVAAVASVSGLIFVLGRLVLVAHGDASIFIVAGSAHVDPRVLPRGIFVVDGNGYDGQFYYRMALDPADLARSAFGIRLDSLSRLERIGYPAIAWVLAAGHPSLVPDTLIVTNVVSLGAVGLGGALLAQDSGRHALWGLALAGYWGYLWSAGRDLTEITAAAFLLLGLWAYRRNRWVLAGVLLLGAVLTKETAAYVVVIIAVTRLAGRAIGRDRRPWGTTDVSWLLPLLAFAAWQLAVFVTTRSVAIGHSGNANIGPPLNGLIDGIRFYWPALPSVASFLWFGELLVLSAIAVGAAVSIRTTTVPVHERLAWAAVVVLAVCAASGIWRGDVGFRSLDDVYLFSWIVLLGTGRGLWPYVGLAGATWLVVAVELLKYV
jgi:hypothetical protein